MAVAWRRRSRQARLQLATPYQGKKFGNIEAFQVVVGIIVATAIQRAEGLWKVFGHAGSVTFSRTTDFEIGKFNDKQVLRRFGRGRRVSMTLAS